MSEGGRQAGAQTLARGLRALLLVVEAGEPMTAAQVAEALGTHRTIAYRLLQTLTEFRMLHQGADGRYSAGAGLASLNAGYQAHLRETALPVMRDAADDLTATVALIAAEGAEAVSVAIATPVSATYHLAFRQGSRHPIDRGSAGYALLSLDPPSADEPEAVTIARERGYASSKDEVEAGAYGIAVPLRVPGMTVRACLNLITFREEAATAAVDRMMLAAGRLSDKLALRGSAPPS
ncbi:MAG: helix-turn-helix domain-containing protein [Streptosporangiales bacterium]|nr:helix-turn-helix domain-containing protein [Streptosporangiales bacterium]